MRTDTRTISTLQRLDYLSALKRKLLWVIIPGLLAGFLAAVVAPGRGISSDPADTSLKPSAPTQPRPMVPEVESSQPNRWFVILVATTIGLVIGAVLALFFAGQAGSSRSESELARLIKIPVLASIPYIETEEPASTTDRE
jgi:H+/Cl- antiporter ClcA